MIENPDLTKQIGQGAGLRGERRLVCDLSLTLFSLFGTGWRKLIKGEKIKGFIFKFIYLFIYFGSAGS